MCLKSTFILKYNNHLFSEVKTDFSVITRTRQLRLFLLDITFVCRLVLLTRPHLSHQSSDMCSPIPTCLVTLPLWTPPTLEPITLLTPPAYALLMAAAKSTITPSFSLTAARSHASQPITSRRILQRNGEGHWQGRSPHLPPASQGLLLLQLWSGRLSVQSRRVWQVFLSCWQQNSVSTVGLRQVVPSTWLWQLIKTVDEIDFGVFKGIQFIYCKCIWC